MNRALVIAALLILLGGVYIAVTKWQKISNSPATPPASFSTTTLSAATTTQKEETKTYVIEANYPQFGISSVDATIKNAVDSAIADFKSIPANPANSSLPKNEFNSSFDAVYAGAEIVSVKLTLSEYTGGAHPNTALVAVNVDRATGRELSLDDALAMIGTTLQQVAEKVTVELRAKLDGSFFPEGAQAKAENYSTFLVNADTVTFIFGEYQVAPYAAGPQEVSFPRK